MVTETPITFENPVLSPSTSDLLNAHLQRDQAAERRRLLCGDRIAKSVAVGRAKRGEREGIEFAKPIDAIVTAGGGRDRLRG